MESIEKPYSKEFPYCFVQVSAYGIGNFIMMTPTIKFLSEYYNVKIPVMFETLNVSRMFQNCPFIKTIKDTNGYEILLRSSDVNQEIPDYKYQFTKVINLLKINLNKNNLIPHTYVDAYPKPVELENINRYCIVLRAGVGDLDAKDPGDEIYNYIINHLNNKIKIVFLGATMDFDRFTHRMIKWCDDPIVILDDIQKTLGAINHANFIISNDTGFYHASGALKKDSFILWKDTNKIKNQSPFNSCYVSNKDEWKNDFNQWIGERVK